VFCFNFFLRTLIAGYLVFAISSFKGTQNPNFSSPILVIQTLFSYFTALVIFATPISMAVFLKKCTHKLDSTYVQNRVGCIY